MESVFKIFDVGKISKFSEVLVSVEEDWYLKLEQSSGIWLGLQKDMWTLTAYLLFALSGVSRKQ